MRGVFFFSLFKIFLPYFSRKIGFFFLPIKKRRIFSPSWEKEDFLSPPFQGGVGGG
jgi:hypothetical protein